MRHIQRSLQEPGQSFFLLGPRGTGKTTWIRDHFKDAVWIDLLLPNEMHFYGAHPERLVNTVEGAGDCKTIVIDEIQKVPELLSVVHHLIEQKKGYNFILTGSSARKLKRTGVDLLAGRALLKFMNPFTASEMGALFSLEKALEIGMLPLVWDNPTPHAVLKTYTALYLKEEVQAEGLVRNIGDFARFLEIISFSHGASLNLNNIATECAVSRSTVSNYLQILEDMLLGYTINVFTKRAQRALTSHPKFYLFDAGVFQALRPKGPLDRPEEIHGAALEGLVAQHLKAWIDEQKESYELSFWRTRGGLEVDFVIYGEKQFWAIEVKNSATISRSDLSGLKAFGKDYPEAKLFLLYRGTRRLLQDNILCIPVSEFLSSFPII
ncbi:MAG TPA: AAA family ATPase [Parachlamydiaceae bacterium]|nr:AAA family ATPase [Parachlamydiaceae bacterium]